MSSCPATPIENASTPCRLSVQEWSVCYANGCYLNYRCPVFRGSRVSPVRDYIPQPPVFILLGNEAVPFFYQADIERIAG